MNGFNYIPIKKRINFIIDIDIIYLLEDDGFYDPSKIEEIPYPLLGNNFSNSLNIINVKYAYLYEMKEKICKIDELKKYFIFIKILANEKQLNLLLLNNKNYTPENILAKINDKAFFGKEFQSILNEKEFPFVNFKLEEEPDSDFINYNKIYRLKNIQPQNIMDNNNEINKRIKKLNDRVNQMEKDLKKKLYSKTVEINKKIGEIKSLINEVFY